MASHEESLQVAIPWGGVRGFPFLPKQAFLLLLRKYNGLWELQGSAEFIQVICQKIPETSSLCSVAPQGFYVKPEVCLLLMRPPAVWTLTSLLEKLALSQATLPSLSLLIASKREALIPRLFGCSNHWAKMASPRLS